MPSLVTSGLMNQSPLSFSSNFVSTAQSWRQSQWRHPRIPGPVPWIHWVSPPPALGPWPPRGRLALPKQSGTRMHAPPWLGSAVALGLRRLCLELTRVGRCRAGGTDSSRTSQGEAAPVPPRSVEQRGGAGAPGPREEEVGVETSLLGSSAGSQLPLSLGWYKDSPCVTVQAWHGLALLSASCSLLPSARRA